ncbi:RNI-like protein [Basidiobolus meristosporus CBS 931.73]|uniref:RNI-like protein n=1 Tax=Basidiobolus meristosporus CBS 931.73 TaxID=1314790 RepID=A0A1Y1YZ75_9FUNG|nr:RNI-like protein [Basidiobolus meristosporus CBS 931.73]|eukprot:ORY03174.1 RNI-like protein [Basidiobolus meristosporus CBS 931.73]
MPILWREPRFCKRVQFNSFKDIVSSNPHVANLVLNLDCHKYRREIILYLQKLVQYFPNLQSATFPCYVPLSQLSSAAGSLPHLTKLTDVQYVDINPTDDGVAFLSTIFHNCQKLRSLSLKMYGVSSVAIPIAFPTSESLTSIELLGDEFNDSFLRAFLQRLPNLTHFELCANDIPRNLISILSAHCSKVNKLKFEFTGIYSDITVHRMIKQMVQKFGGKLKKLGIFFSSEARVTIPDDLLIKMWRSFPLLEHFGFSHIQFNNSLLSSFAKFPKPHLQSLELNYISRQNSFTLDAWEHFLSKCGANLTSLSISFSVLPEDLGTVIGKYCTKLQEVSLSFTNVTDSTVLPISQGCRSLRKFDLNTTNITSSSIEHLCKHCTHLEVIVLDRQDNTLCPLELAPFIDFFESRGGQVKQFCVAGWAMSHELLKAIAKNGTHLREFRFTNGEHLSDSSLKEVMDSCVKLRRLQIIGNPDDLGISKELLKMNDQSYCCN